MGREPEDEGDARTGAHTEKGVRAEAEAIAMEARQQAQSFADAGREQLAERFASVGRALVVTGEQLRTEHQPELSRYTDLAANKIQATARYLQEHDTDAVVATVEKSLQRRPALFLGGALGVGLLIGRFLRSSAVHSRERQQTSDERSGRRGTPGSGKPATERWATEPQGSNGHQSRLRQGKGATAE